MTKTWVAAAMLAGAWALATPVPAQAVTASITGSYAFDWSYGHKVTSCDSAGDSKPVRAEYYMNNGGQTAVENYGGNGTCADSAYESSLINRIAACRGEWYGWSCGNTVRTGY
ncbi:hypothetical protein [Micromonospora echinofusca]|uniref:Uncharacterized protein n=1 Tax=Micromonospora echinofusca TaxID=47858 RepID=A0ABS3VVP1_MICEH|nr:hypothetical protein [Micromonospora echinofusca]MBO4208599.1 hypothetical protein [Micromonospora echinofusca]